MNDNDDTDLRNEWHPTTQEFDEYQHQDAVLCAGNLEVILRNSSRPLSLRDLKDVCLHNSTTVERALRASVSEGRIQEIQGKVNTYALNV